MERFFRPLRVWEETNWSQSRRRPSQLRSRVCCGHQPSSLQQNYFIAILLIDALIYNYMHKKSRDITALLWCVILSYRIYLNCLPPGQLQSGPHLSEEGHPNFSEPFIQGRKELRIINNCYVQKYQYYCINIKCLLLLTYQTGKMNKKSILPVPCWFCGGGLACQACHQLTHCYRHQQLAHQQHHQTCPIITYISLSPTSLKGELTKLWPD